MLLCCEAEEEITARDESRSDPVAEDTDGSSPIDSVPILSLFSGTPRIRWWALVAVKWGAHGERTELPKSAWKDEHVARMYVGVRQG